MAQPRGAGDLAARRGPQHLEVTEPEHGNALHGLLLRTKYRVVHRSSASATLAAPVRPQPGYPFALDTSVRYDLLEQGLEVTHTVSNVGGRAAPVALGAHPYLCLGDAATGDLVLHIDAASHYRDDERHIVQEKVSTTGGPEDLTGGRRVGTGPRNTTYTDLALVDGYRRHRLVGPDGTSVELWADEAFSHVQVFSTTDVPGGSTTEVALAVEPMTAAPDAFNNGRGLRWLDPGRTWSVQWGLGHHGPASDAGGR